MTNPRLQTFARKDVAASEYSRLGAAGARAVESPEFAHLTGSLRDKCRNEALRESVRQELKWAKPPTGSFLYEEVQTHHERAKAPEQEKPKRRPPKKRGPPSPKPPPPAKLSKQAPAPAKPAPLADQNAHAGALVVAPAAAPSQLAQFHAAVELAEKARTGKKVGARGAKPKACEVRRAGEDDDKWRRFETRKDAAAAFSGLTAPDVTKLCNDDPRALATLRPTLCGKFEARNVGEGASVSKTEANSRVLHAAGFSFTTRLDVGSDAAALGVVQRGPWEIVDLPPPQSWGNALESMGEFSEEDWHKFVAATREAENERVRQVRTATLREKADAALLAARQAGTAGHDGYVDEDFDIERAEREDREAELDRLRRRGAPDWMQRVAEDEIKARRRRAWWREQKQRVGPPNNYFASL